LTKEASVRDIKKAYFHLARQYHPDKLGNDIPKEKAHEQFLEFAHAYEILSDSKKKARYDKLLSFGQVVYFEDERLEHDFREEKFEEEEETSSEYQFNDPFKTYEEFFTNVEQDKDFEYFTDQTSTSALAWSSGVILLVVIGLFSTSLLKNSQKTTSKETKAKKSPKNIKRKNDKTRPSTNRVMSTAIIEAHEAEQRRLRKIEKEPDVSEEEEEEHQDQDQDGDVPRKALREDEEVQEEDQEEDQEEEEDEDEDQEEKEEEEDLEEDPEEQDKVHKENLSNKKNLYFLVLFAKKRSLDHNNN